jgi:hypothetical protein
MVHPEIPIGGEQMTKNMKPWVWVVAFCSCGMFLTVAFMNASYPLAMAMH